MIVAVLFLAACFLAAVLVGIVVGKCLAFGMREE